MVPVVISSINYTLALNKQAAYRFSFAGPVALSCFSVCFED